MPFKSKGLLARRCISGQAARQLIVNGQPLRAPPLYQHPAHAHPVVNAGRSLAWTCGICKFAQVEGGAEQRQRYKCEQGCKFDVCADCMAAEYSFWLVHRDRFLRGDAMVFAGLKYAGVLQVGETWPDPTSHDGYLDVLDAARRAGQLPWRAKDIRALHVTSSYLSITGDPSSGMEWERQTETKVFVRIPAMELASITCLDDNPVFLLALVGPAIGCHVLECPSLEIAEGISDAIQKGFDHKFQEAVLDTMDDSIQAGAEGRPAKYAPPEIRFMDTLREAQRQHKMEEEEEDEEEEEEDAPPPLTPEQQAVLVAEYMALLRRSLGQAEVGSFAELMRNYRVNRDFAPFSQGLLALFGSHSKQLLPGILPFLPLEDRPTFENFIATVQ